MYDDNTRFRLAALRQKAINGTASPEELREGLLILRNGRLTATNRASLNPNKKSADRTAKPKPNVGGMLGELAGL